MNIKAICFGILAPTVCLLFGSSNQVVGAESDSKIPEIKVAQFIYIAGEVKVPNRYVYTEDLTLSKALKLAKGVTSSASDKVTLSREGSEKQTFGLATIQKGDSKDVKLKPGDKLFVAKKE